MHETTLGIKDPPPEKFPANTKLRDLKQEWRFSISYYQTYSTLGVWWDLANDPSL